MQLRLTRSLFAVLLIAALVLAVITPATLTAATDTQPISAISPAKQVVTRLARFYPRDTTFYISLRTDEAYIQELDAILQKVISKIPGVPAIKLPELLRQAASNAGLDYDADVRSWLGNSAAFGIGNLNNLFDQDRQNDSATVALLTVEITDQAKAIAFFERFVGQASTKSEEGGITIFDDNNSDAVLAIAADTLFLGTEAGFRSTLLRDTKLDQVPLFTELVAALPAENYNVIAYLDLNAIIAGLTAAMPAAMVNQMNLSLVGASAQIMTMGATVLDGRTLTLDFVQRVTNPEALKQLGVDYTVYKPVKAEFAAYLPADTALLIHGSNLNAYYEQILATLRATAEMQGAGGDLMERELQRVTDLVEQALGLSLSDDILKWMSGDFAVFTSYTPAETSLFEALIVPGREIPFSGLNLGVLIEATDPAAATKLVDALAKLIEQQASNTPNMTLSKGEGEFTLSFASAEFSNDIELVIGATDKVFYIATKEAVTQIKAGTGGFADSANAADAAKYLLPNSAQNWIITPEAMPLLVDLFGAQSIATQRIFSRIRGGLDSSATPTPDATEDDRFLVQFRQIRFITSVLKGLISSSTLSSTYNEDGATVTSRATISLPE
ncbi:MAG: hypothetical protein OHK0023_12660 [Anaerolineae bacterium]